MKKFVFNLQSDLDHRRLLEEREEEKLASIQQKIALAEAERLRLYREIHDLRLQTAQPDPGEVQVERVLQTLQYVAKLDGDLATLARRIDDLERQRRSQSDAWLVAKRNREVLEKLKEKNLAEHEREAQAMEQKLLDELAAAKFAPHDEQNLPAVKR